MAMKETAGTGAISLFDYYNGGDGDLFANGSDSDDGLMKEGGLICLSATYVDLNTREEYHARQRLLWGGHSVASVFKREARKVYWMAASAALTDW
ncbi:hypothetical protein PInf_009736 [Phytophthora infestans]|nr:hypothetical protein PInf_009736 [Phytophthora infestans]